MGQREQNGFMKQTDVANMLYAEVVQRQRHEPQKLVSVGSNPTPSTRVGVPQSEKSTSHQGANCGVINRGP